MKPPTPELDMTYDLCTPYTHHLEELLQCHFSLCNQNHVLDNHLVPDEVHSPDLPEGQVMQLPADTQVLHQLLPVALLQGLGLQLCHKHVHLESRQMLQVQPFTKYHSQIVGATQNCYTTLRTLYPASQQSFLL